MKHSRLFSLGCLAAYSFSPAFGAEIARYQFEHDLTDSIGTSDAVAVGSPSFVASPHGTALQTDSGNYAVVPNGSSFHPGLSSFSIGLQFRVSGANHGLTFAPLLTMQADDFADGISLAVGTGSEFGDRIAVLLDDGNGNGTQTLAAFNSPVSLLNTWHGVAMVVDRGTSLLNLVLNGVEVASVPLATGSIDPTSGMLIGQYDFGFARNGHPRFVGGNGLMVDEVRVFDTALSTVEAGAVTAVPEASTWAAGAVLAGLGVWTYRRSSVAARSC